MAGQDGCVTELSIVIPAYDEAATLAAITDEVRDAAAAQRIDHEVLIVDDGSTDGTFGVAATRAADDPSVRVVRHEANRGSGAAIRSGVAAARGTFVIYVPADGQFDTAELGRYLAAGRSGADVVIGARRDRHDYTAFRRGSSRVYLSLINGLFGLGHRDVNWVHLWRREPFVRHAPRSSGVFLLAELLVLTRRAGGTVVEVDSAYRPRRGGRATGARPSTIVRTLVELARCWCRWTLKLG